MDNGRTEENVAILFADVVDSSRLYTTYGDAEARNIVGSCLDAMGQVVGEFSGKVVKNIGDEIMCAFNLPGDAVTAAVTMQQRLGELRGNGTLHNSLSLRIGIHFGEAVADGGDYFGDAVNLASRMASFSKAHQIMTSRQTVDALEDALRPLARFVDTSTVKGQTGLFELYEIVWDSHEATMAASGIGPQTDRLIDLKLDVIFGGETRTLDLEHPVLTIGRSQQCDLVVNEVRASRFHARIEFGKDGFALKDVSTNGTYVRMEDSGSHHVRRDQITLSSNGLLRLGDEFGEDTSGCIRFNLREEKRQL